MCDDIFSYKSFKRTIAEMSALITDYSTRHFEVRENILFQELDNNLVVIYFARNDFNTLRHIVHSNKNVLVPK